jgi:hypothetical protein
MSVRKLAVGAFVAVLAFAVLIPAANAKQMVSSSVCIERPHPEPESRQRDVLTAPKRDELSRWISRNPAAAASAAARVSGGAPITIPVWFHIIRRNLSVAGGNVPLSRIDAQVDVLNDSYSGRTGGARTGFRFALAGVTRTTNAGWFNNYGYGAERAMKEALHVGGTATLNIYTTDPGANILGFAYLAQDAEEVGVLDGVVVDHKSLPGGPYAVYSEGDTATHEVGHWLDLFHTFEGGCEGEGDHIADTAPEASPAFSCPVGRDSCAGGGIDPITNFMDYTQDSCMFEFTADQAARMQQAWTAYRA